MTENFEENRICVGVVTGPHGLNGAVKIKSYMVSKEDIAAFGPVTDKTGKSTYNVQLKSSNNRNLIAELSGVEDRDASESIVGTELYLPRNVLPKLADNEFYYSDLLGLTVTDTEGQLIGKISLIDNYGAGEVMEVNLKEGGTRMFRMSREVVPEINLRKGQVIINPPDEIIADEDHFRKFEDE
ncbi:MAG: ribosome maturation factor RimM [Pseudomonadota bacterium]|nr:ribosome maturation factor RimM [Pseudomonadota bacterium]